MDMIYTHVSLLPLLSRLPSLPFLDVANVGFRRSFISLVHWHFYKVSPSFQYSLHAPIHVLSIEGEINKAAKDDMYQMYIQSNWVSPSCSWPRDDLLL